MIRAIRKNPIVNKLVRLSLEKLLSHSTQLKRKILPHWRLSGAIPLSIARQSFTMISICDDLLVDAIYYGWNDEDLEMDLFAELAGKSKLVFDIGANTGVFSLLAKASNENCEIFAFEPYEPNVNRLIKNIALNHFDSIHVVPKAIGDRIDKLTFTIPADGRISTVGSFNGAFTRIFHSKEIKYFDTKVDCITLDSFWQEIGRRPVDLMKIDVESCEVMVFAGGLNFLRNTNPTIICEISTFDSSIVSYLNEKLKKLEFEIYGIFADNVKWLGQLERLPIRNFLLSRVRTPKEIYYKSELRQLVEDLTK